MKLDTPHKKKTKKNKKIFRFSLSFKIEQLESFNFQMIFIHEYSLALFVSRPQIFEHDR